MMTDKIQFFVNSISFETNDSEKTAADILEMAGKPSGKFHLVQPDGVRCTNADAPIEVQPGDSFTTESCDRHDEPALEAGAIDYKVNGEIQSTTQPILSLETILKNAGKAASIELSQINHYFLENVKTGRQYRNLADEVNIHAGDNFLAVHIGATPVAHSA